MNELEYILSKISEELDVIQVSLTSGAPKDYAEYQHLCGKIRGLLAAESIVTALKERMEKDDE